MRWYEIATGEGDDALASRQRILDYNEDDCRATAALRDWLNGPARRLPHRDDQ
jgi:predicted RecB family nuclease